MSASTTSTVSRLAATTCAADVRPATVRVNADLRGRTATASSPRSAIQSPTAGEATPAQRDQPPPRGRAPPRLVVESRRGVHPLLAVGGEHDEQAAVDPRDAGR